MRRCNGICPPSKPRRREYPRRDFCPLLPAPEVLPSFEPMPRPTRTLRLREPFAGPRFERETVLCSAFFFLSAMTLFHHFHEMAHLVNHAANRRRIFALHHLMQSAQPKAADRCPHVVGATD